MGLDPVIRPYLYSVSKSRGIDARPAPVDTETRLPTYTSSTSTRLRVHSFCLHCCTLTEAHEMGAHQAMGH